jgi:dTDP-4-dehydrorhamnose 3,5-epimerase
MSKIQVVNNQVRMDGRSISSHDLFKNSGMPGQVNVSKIFPGVVKAFHYHEKQWDYWYCIDGSAHVVLVHGDWQNGSPIIEHHYIGEGINNTISIPPNVLHGYRALGDKPASILYYETEKYDGSDEMRIPFDYFGDSVWKTINE